jgi:hypothetical protein
LISKTRLTERVKAFDWQGLDADLAEAPQLLGYRDERGRNWLHLCCATELKGRHPAASLKTADVLLARGIDLAGHAFTEGAWKATPVWFAIGRGRNLALAEHLLKKGADPNYSLWAAGFLDDPASVDLLVRYGALLEDPAVSEESPFVSAVKWSHFKAAEALARHGADVNARDEKGLTALHLMLKKDSDAAHFEMLARYGARGDIPGPDGQTAAQIMARKKDPRFKALAAKLAAAAVA